MRQPRDCRICQAIGTTTCDMTEWDVPYGRGPDEAILRVVVPVWTCSECSDCYTDGEAEIIIDEAIRKHRETQAAHG